MLGLLAVVGAVSWYFADVNSRAVASAVESVEDVRPIASSGQHMPGEGRKWSERIVLAGAVDKVVESVDDMRLAARSAFDVYLDENRLVYFKEECGDEDVAARFFLHLRAVDVAELPLDREQHGFDNLDFFFETVGLYDGRRCAAERLLPDYRIASIDTGQYVPGEGRKWQARIAPGAVDEMIGSVVDMRPAARSTFDVYLDGNRLVYVKEECSHEDVAARFFLHLRAVDVAELPLDRQQHGFDNLDFLFGTFGFHDGRRCAAERLLPDYRVASIDTGQYVPGESRVWSETISIEAP